MENSAVGNEVKKRMKYSWGSLTEIGMSFTIPKEESKAIGNIRQTIYAANKNAAKKGVPNRYKATKQDDGSVKVERVS